ncbi:MAG: YicC family protein [Phycisphaerae bacterium]|nr:YicC family protein [Phycisphaerae bacterium]
MLQSMTGFGDALFETENMSFTLEIKTVNNRFLKTSVRLPDTLNFAEAEIERIIRKRLSRGTVNFTLHMRNTSSGGALQVNQAAAETYLNAIELLIGEKQYSINAANILQLPGVCQSPEYSEDQHKEFLHIVKKMTSKALDKLIDMRIKEGQELLKDLQDQCKAIAENLEEIKNKTVDVVQRYRNKIQQRVNELLSGQNIKLDEETLHKEVAVFAERSDINEEISRLTSHLQQFKNICQKEDQAGRRLDFMTQEMLREANTIASKANDAEISQHVVEIKVAIDRLREQVQNAE